MLSEGSKYWEIENIAQHDAFNKWEIRIYGIESSRNDYFLFIMIQASSAKQRNPKDASYFDYLQTWFLLWILWHFTWLLCVTFEKKMANKISIPVDNRASGLAQLHYYPHLEKCNVIHKALLNVDVRILIFFWKCHSGIKKSVTSQGEIKSDYIFHGVAQQ